MNQENVGRFIAKLRKEKNITQQDLANKLGVTDRAISNWENGNIMPSVEMLIKIADFFSVSTDYLFSKKTFKF